jgi:glutathione synthase/RimK-type ligase-like ATP-grasp enzyme
MTIEPLIEIEPVGAIEPAIEPAVESLIGLARLARLAFAGTDLDPVKTLLLHRLVHNQQDANALMDLSMVCQLMGQRDLGLTMQGLALRIQQVYSLPPAAPARVRLLAILSPGDLAENHALEFLIENSDIALDLLYVHPDLPFPATLPDHDLAMVAVSESDPNRPLLKHLEFLLAAWPRPVLCPPDRIARLSRDGACTLLQSAPGLVVPVTTRIDRSTLERIGRGEQSLADYPMIVRPTDSQKGFGLVKVESPAAIVEYLKTRPENAFYLAPYIDYRGPDGQFRKYRIVLIDERPYVCHMAISDRWMVHYVKAGMFQDAVKRAEEEQFFATFDDNFARRHHAALRHVAQRLGLEYVGLDCAETPAGELLIFEVDSAMTVHAMDPVDIFPYKQPQMQKVFRAFRQMLLTATHTRENAALPND